MVNQNRPSVNLPLVKTGKISVLIERLGLAGFFTWFSFFAVVVLVALSVMLAGSLAKNAFALCGVILAVWFLTLGYALIHQAKLRHTHLSKWLFQNLYNSPANMVLTLLVLLLAATVLFAFWDYAVVRATVDPALTSPEARPENVGASWGVLIGASKLILTGTLKLEYLPRVWAAFWITLGLALLTWITSRVNSLSVSSAVRNIISGSWLALIPVIYILLAGVPFTGAFLNPGVLFTGEGLVLGSFAILYWQKVVNFSYKQLVGWAISWPAVYLVWRAAGASGYFPVINVDHWGGLLLTMIITVFSIVVSFPIGVGLALGRRSSVRGIPAWFIYAVCAGLAVWGLAGSTSGMLAEARNWFERILAFWPLLILAAAFLFQKAFKGNVISAASTLYIEIIRGVPLITILFMAIVMAPLFFPEGIKLKNTWAVLAGYTLFNSAYIAEIVRGGLQAIPGGQFEAADSLGLNSLQKVRFIILPQALTLVIPALVGQFVGVFKSSSLVGIVGLFDLMGIVSSVTGNPRWQGLRTELYIFVAVLYFFGSFAMTSYSRRLEKRLEIGKR